MEYSGALRTGSIARTTKVLLSIFIDAWVHVAMVTISGHMNDQKFHYIIVQCVII